MRPPELVVVVLTLATLLSAAPAAGMIRFQDRCGRSFARYEGAWKITERADGATTITYQLAAKPSFDVPEFFLKRLLKHDADQMIQRLQAEIARRTF